MSVLSNNTLAGSSGQGGGGYQIERSLRFNSGDSSYLNRTPSSAGNRKTWTYSGWVKRAKLGTRQYIFTAGLSTGSSESTYMRLAFTSGDKFWVGSYNYNFRYTDMLFRDPSAWYHIVVAFDSTKSTEADRCIIYVNGVQQSTTGSPNIVQNNDYGINSTELHKVSGDSYFLDGYLADVQLIDGQALAPTDFGEYDDNNVWQPKKYSGSYGTNGFHLDFSDTSSDAALGTDSSGNSNTWTNNNLTVTNLGATSNSSVSASNTYAVSDAYGTNTYYTFSQAFDANASTTGVIGQVIFHNEGTYSKPIVSNSSGGVEVIADGAGVTAAINGGSQVTCTDGSFTKISGTFNGTLDSINVYNNTSGNSYFKSVRVNGVEIAVRKKGPASEIDFYRDSPSQIADQTDTGVGGEVVGNYATWNPLFGENQSLSNGNLKAESSTTGYAIIASTIAMKSGKWYMEYTYTPNNGQPYISWGISQTNRDGTAGSGVTDTAEDKGFKAWDSGFYSQSAGSNVHDYSSSVSSGDIISLAFDADAGKLWVAKNGTWMTNASGTGNPATGANPDYSSLTYSGGYYFMAGPYYTNGSTLEANFGQRAFAYTAPSGYKALCTANLPDPTIADGSTAFDSKLYSGTGSSQSITGLGFSPDLVWTKNRGASASHALYDSVRGAGELLRSNETTAEVNVSSRFTSFDSNGFSIGGPSIENNGSSNSYVSWAWDAGSSNTTIAAGSLTNTLYDSSQTWSTYGTFDNHYNTSGYTWDKVFNTHLNYDAAGSLYVNSSTADKWTLTSSIAVQNKIKIYTYGYTTVVVNDGLSDQLTVNSTGNTFHYFEFDFSGNMSNISVVPTTIGGTTGTIYFMGIWIDGKQLVDTAPSVPSIASTVRANPSAGFSIVSFVNTSGLDTIAHGLNATPKLYIFKSLSTGAWYVYPPATSFPTGYLLLNGTDGKGTNTTYFLPEATSTTFSMPNGFAQSSSDPSIAYCFAPVESYSSMGTFLGNGSADGPFVFTGFRPAFILLKSSTTSRNWHIFDTKRDVDNLAEYGLYPNLSSAESNIWFADINSNGFKIRTTNDAINGSGVTYLYYAVAEHPFKTSRAR